MKVIDIRRYSDGICVYDTIGKNGCTYQGSYDWCAEMLRKMGYRPSSDPNRWLKGMNIQCEIIEEEHATC